MPPIVFHRDTAVGVDGDIYLGTHPGQGLVNRVVNDLIDQVVQGLDIRATDIHPRTPANSFQALEYLDVFRSV
jgi:hypothetical protein